MKISESLLFEVLSSSYMQKDAELTKKYNRVFKADLHDEYNYVSWLFVYLHKKLTAFNEVLTSYRQYVKENKVNPTTLTTDMLEKDFLSLENEISFHNSQLKKLSREYTINSIQSLREFEDTMYGYKELYRYLSSRLASLYTGSDWRSATYDSSRYANIFYTEDTNKTICNYKRYGYKKLEDIEEWYQNQILDEESPELKTLITSSGMSSYALVEDFLTKNILDSSDLIMTSPYIYFENREQLEKNKVGTYLPLTSYDTTEILLEIKERKPKVVFLDPITNTGEINLIDLPSLIRELDALMFESPFYLVIDNSLLTDSFNPFQYKNIKNKNFRLIHFESCNKYRQLGMDMLMMGAITCLKEDAEQMERSRRNTGQALYDYYAHLFPMYPHRIGQDRYQKLSRNALLISSLLQKVKGLDTLVQVQYPLLKNHKDYKVAKKYKFCGGLVTFIFKDEKLQSSKVYNQYIEKLLVHCKLYRIPLNNGVSFGFEVSRISAAANMAGTINPFLRLSIGAENIHNILLLAKAMEEVFVEFFRHDDQISFYTTTPELSSSILSS